jgi:hypothetical protein
MPGKSSSVGKAELTVSWLPMLIILVAQITDGVQRKRDSCVHWHHRR